MVNSMFVDLKGVKCFKEITYFKSLPMYNRAQKVEAYLEPKRISTAYYFPNKNSIIYVQVGYM